MTRIRIRRTRTSGPQAADPPSQIVVKSLADSVFVGDQRSFSWQRPVQAVVRTSNLTLADTLAAGGTGTYVSTVTLTADPTITPTATELVTFGVPLPEGAVANATQIRVTRAGSEQAIFCKAGLTYHWSDNSLRSVIVQLVVDMQAGDVSLVIDNQGRNTGADLAYTDIFSGWFDGPASPDGTALKSPRILVLHDRTDLQESGLLPPYIPSTTDGDPEDLQYTQAASLIAGFPYGDTGNRESWLFDRVTSALKLSFTFADFGRRREMLKHAALSYWFYMRHIDKRQEPAAGGGRGGFTYSWTESTAYPYRFMPPYDMDCESRIGCSDGVIVNGTPADGNLHAVDTHDASPEHADSDGKYIYTQPIKLALAIFGEDQLWNNALVDDMARQAEIGNFQAGTLDLYDSEGEAFTERAAGITGLAAVGAWEVTGTSSWTAAINSRIASLIDMQRVEKEWDQSNGWTPLPGFFRHSWANHEGATLEIGHTIAEVPAGVSTITIAAICDSRDYAAMQNSTGWYFGGNFRRLAAPAVSSTNGTLTFALTAPTSSTIPINRYVYGVYAPGLRSDRAASPWMSENIADFLWQAYHLGFRTDDAGIPETFRRLARGIDNYGFYGRNNGNGTFTKVASYSDTPTWNANNYNPAASYVLYAMSDLATPLQVDRDRLGHYRSDFHAPEMLTIFGPAYYFADNAADQAKWFHRIAGITSAFLHPLTAYTRTDQGSIRLINWQNRSMPWQTWKWCEANAVAEEPPNIYITSPTVTEGTGGQKTMTFQVYLDQAPTTADVTFDYATRDGTATAGSDYAQTSGSGVIPVGQQTFDIPVVIYSDSAVEGTEQFYMDVTNIVGATVP